jgi:NAD(P)-dependent dehydrogenase (short-subunit alcohol dehydrogenase family)
MGAEHARLLVAEGAKVVIGDILDDEGKAVADEIGDAVRYVHLDVTQPDQWDAAVETAVGEFGKLNVLVNNAGTVALGPLRSFDLAKWQKVIDVNLTGTFLGMRVAVDPMIAAGAARSSTCPPSRACAARRWCTRTSPPSGRCAAWPSPRLWSWRRTTSASTPCTRASSAPR